MSLFDIVDSAAEDVTMASLAPTDTGLGEVEAWFRAHEGLARTFASLIRRGLDEVIDGGRTGRWSLVQLEPTEKTYIGTKMEILVRDVFELPREKPLDTVVCGHPLDIKWSANRAGWQIPTEAIGHLCLLLSANEIHRTYEVGVVRCTADHLNRGKNKDQKTTLSAEGRAAIRWLARGELPANFLATLAPAVRDEVMAQPKGQARVRKLFTLVQRTPVPRLAIVTLAQQPGDPMRRIRRDRGDRLKGLVVLGGHYRKTSEIVAALGYKPLAKDEYMSVPLPEIRAHGLEL